MCHKANKQHFLAINPRRCFGALKKSRKQFSPQWVSPTTGAERGSERPLDLHHQEASGTSRSAKWKNEYRAERPKTNAVRPTPPALCMGCTLLCYRLSAFIHVASGLMKDVGGHGTRQRQQPAGSSYAKATDRAAGGTEAKLSSI